MLIDAERLVRKCGFVAPSPPRTGAAVLSGEPQTWARSDLGGGARSRRSRLLHTVSSTSSEAAVPNTNRESARERGTLICARVGKLDSDLALQGVCHRKTF